MGRETDRQRDRYPHLVLYTTGHLSFSQARSPAWMHPQACTGRPRNAKPGLSQAASASQSIVSPLCHHGWPFSKLFREWQKGRGRHREIKCCNGLQGNFWVVLCGNEYV